MSLGFETGPLKNPNNCTDPYTPSFWLGKPGALTQIRMPNAGWPRPAVDNFAVHNLLDGQAVDRSPYQSRSWTFSHEWLKPDVMSVFAEYATRQRGIGPFVLIDPQMKNLLTPNQASGTDALHTSDGFSVTGSAGLSSVTTSPVQGERSLRWSTLTLDQIFDTFTRTVAAGSLGTSDSGQTYDLTGTAADFQVISGVARITTNTVGSLYYGVLDTGHTNHTVQVSLTIPVLPLTQPFTLRIPVRWTDASNYYEAELNIATSGSATLVISKRVLGSRTQIASAGTVGTHAAGNTWTMVADIQDNVLRARAWNASTSSDPTVWLVSGSDSVLTTGTRTGFGVRRETGNTNGAVNFDFDDLLVLNPLGGGPLKLVPPTNLHGWCLPPGSNFAFSGYVTGDGSNTSVTVTPRVVLMNGTGAVQSTISGSAIIPVTGSAQSFCVTGSVPVGASGVYLQPQFVITGAVLTPTIAAVLIDQLQLELIDGTVCTQWEYGQGQPLVSVRVDTESVPRILRTDMSFVAVEVT